jgi:hypothetical protein
MDVDVDDMAGENGGKESGTKMAGRKPYLHVA